MSGYPRDGQAVADVNNDAVRACGYSHRGAALQEGGARPRACR